jgi:hypothetical protein
MGKTSRKAEVGRTGSTYEMDNRDNGCEEGKKMELTLDSDQLRVFVLAVLNLQVHFYQSVS